MCDGLFSAWCTVAIDHPYEVPSSPDSASEWLLIYLPRSCLRYPNTDLSRDFLLLLVSMNSSASDGTLLKNGHHHRTMSKSSSTSSTSSAGGYTTPALMYYTDKPDPRLKDFKKFDLEAWWGRRLYQNITKSLWERETRSAGVTSSLWKPQDRGQSGKLGSGVSRGVLERQQQ